MTAPGIKMTADELFRLRSDGAIQLLHAVDTITAEPVLPGFECRLGDLF